jgi:hypothetical protein
MGESGLWIVDTVELLLSGGPWVCRWLKWIFVTALTYMRYDTYIQAARWSMYLLAIRCTDHGTMGMSLLLSHWGCRSMRRRQAGVSHTQKKFSGEKGPVATPQLLPTVQGKRLSGCLHLPRPCAAVPGYLIPATLLSLGPSCDVQDGPKLGPMRVRWMERWMVRWMHGGMDGRVE